MVASSSTPTPLADELRTLFQRSDHQLLVTRAEQVLKRKRVDHSATRNIIQALRAASLIHLGRIEHASPIIAELQQQASSEPLDDTTTQLVTFAQLYIAWSTNQAVPDAIRQITSIPGDDARKLEAQLLYRSGAYAQSSQLYRNLFDQARTTLEEKKRPVTTSRWSLARARPAAVPVTAAELERYANALNELATNYMAALVLDGESATAEAIKQNLVPSYELEYNAACAKIHENDLASAEICLEKAEALFRASMDDDEDDIEEAIAPIRVQKAYLRHMAGEVAAAEKDYSAIMTDRKADTGSLAVAANNLTVALGQLAFGKKDVLAAEGENPQLSASAIVLQKEQHDALAEGLKKMRATSGKSVERKLTLNQRRAMARNRAILLVQMGRLDACRGELTKLKAEFPNDPLVPLIEASLVARQGALTSADNMLCGAGDSHVVRGARVQLAAISGEGERAAALLQELFPGRPAAIVTAASLLESSGNVKGSLELLRGCVANASASNVVVAKKVLADALLRNGDYEEAAEMVRELCAADTGDVVSQAKLVIATSYFNAEEAERSALQLPLVPSETGHVDVEKLEASAPPKRRNVGKNVATANGLSGKLEEDDAAAKAAAARERKKKKRKKRLPKNYDPDGPPPDPERWLPKTLRSGYKKKKKRGEQNNFRGSQGADAAAAEVAAAKNAERSAARAANSAPEVALPPGGRNKQRKKKNRR